MTAPGAGHVRSSSDRYRIAALRQPTKRANKRHHAHSFDHLVGGYQQLVRHGQAQPLGYTKIDDHFEFGRLHDRQVSGLFALENPASVDADPR